jgi:hypothetical protein
MRKSSLILVISSGNKANGIITLAATVLLLALFFVLLDTRWETLPLYFLTLLLYSFQASVRNYISFDQRQFIIENIFRRAVRKEASLFIGIHELFPLMPLMRMKFKDGSSYLFLGIISAGKLTHLIKEAFERPV